MRHERRSDLLDVLRESPRRVEAVLRGLPRAALLWTPAPAHWSILEVACHLRDLESEAYLDPYRRIAAGERPVLAAIDPESRALDRSYREQRLLDVLRAWRRARKEVLAILESLADATWQRQAEQPGAEPLDLESLVERHAEHDQAHLRQIETILERRSILERLAAAPPEIRSLLTRLPPGAARPGTGGASVAALEELERLGDFEARMLSRYCRIVEQDHPVLRPLDAERTAGRRGAASVQEARREFERLRGLTLELLHALGPRLWQRRGGHPLRGDLSIAELVAQHLDHDAERIAVLRAVLATYFDSDGLAMPITPQAMRGPALPTG